jgi:integrase
MPKVIKNIRGIFERPKKSGKWWISYYLNGKHIREFAGNRTQARKFLNKRKEEIRLGKLFPEMIKLKHKCITVSEIIGDYILACESAKQRSIKDVRYRSTFWKENIGDQNAKLITPDDLEQLRIKLSQNKSKSNNLKTTEGESRSPATVNRYLAVLRAAYSKAIHNGKVEKNPVSHIYFQKEENERVRYLTREEEEQLFKFLPKEHHALVIIALQTGMRKSEQLNLKWKEITYENNEQGYITVKRSKSGRQRLIPIGETAINTLKSLTVMINNEYVFFGKVPGKPFKDIPKEWEECLKKAGIDDFHWHDLRHTYASRLVMAGVPIYTVQTLLGHSTIKVTERYSHLSPEHLKQVIKIQQSIAELAPKLAPTKTVAS